MARRPVFIADATGTAPVRERSVDFQWHAGLSLAQKQKSIAALHEAARAIRGAERLLEISSKSPDRLGVALSAFNLTFSIATLSHPVSVECAFQGSKVFEDGGPFTDMFEMVPREAKRDQRLLSSGRLTGFRFLGLDWGLEPRTAFYDWLYISALKQRDDLADRLDRFDAFTDIEFNPDRSINCQARSAALFLSLRRRNLLETATASREAMLRLVEAGGVDEARPEGDGQLSLL